MSDEHSPHRAGFLVKQGTVELLAASGRYKRIIRGNLDRETFMNQTSIWKKHIIGPIPTVPTGFRTENKKQLASVGIHRAIQAGIDGSVDLQKVFSIVMSGEYGEDEDRGDEVVYTGSGGRDASGQQTFDQTLDRRNVLLAKCCAASVNSIDGADAGENWRQGVPIRVIRGAGVARHDDASYCPAEGYRYDGVYKVQQYWPSQGYSGHRVWRFILKRDDRSPAPYSADGKAKMNQVAPRLFRDTDMAKRNDYLITFRAVLMLWRVHPGFWEGTEIPYPKSKKLKDTKEFNEALDIPENLVYKPGKKLLRAIHDDRMNMRIWRRLLSRKYQLETNICDLMSFCEVALTQLEFQCLLCRSSQRIKTPFDIPLVHPNALHCLRCDFNICSACNQAPKSRAIKTCPNCLAPNALFSTTTLEGVFAAMNIPRR